MKRLSNNLSAVLLFALLAAWVCSTGALVRACQTGCNNKCFPATGWCYTNTDGQNYEQFPSPVVQNDWCTDGQGGGTPAIFQLVNFVVYDKCTPDCSKDLATGSTSAIGVSAVKRRDDKGTFKTQCNKS